MSSDAPPEKPPFTAFLSPEAFAKLAKLYGGLAYLGSIPGSPAESARLRRGDVVVAVNGQPTPDIEAFLIARESRSGSATVRYIREGEEREVELVWRKPTRAP